MCELFAGVGGFRLGLELSTKGTVYQPWKTVFADQWEPSRKRQDAFACYVAHFGDSPAYRNEDIATIDKHDIPNHTLLCAGFPCQDYSVARTNAKGIEGKKGVLWWQILDTVKAKHPPFILLENVDRLLKSPARQRGRDFGIILASLMQEGYAVEWRVINAADYGFCQRRRRIYILALRLDTSYGRQMAPVAMEDVLQCDGVLAKAFPVVNVADVKHFSIDLHDLAAVSDKFNFSFQDTRYASEGEGITATGTPFFTGYQMILADVLDKDVPASFYIKKANFKKFRYLKGAKRIPRTRPDGSPYIYSEGPIAFPDPIDRPARTLLTSEGSISRSTHVIEDPHTHQLRLLTPSEAEVVQGFPKGWTDTGMSERVKYFCIGNALVVGCITSIGRILNDILAGEKKGQS